MPGMGASLPPNCAGLAFPLLCVGIAEDCTGMQGVFYKARLQPQSHFRGVLARCPAGSQRLQ